MSRSDAAKIMAKGGIRIATKLFNKGKFNALISLGGAIGTSISSKIMNTFPIGIPKIIVSPMASGNVRTYIGGKDIILINSIGDIALNKITKRIYRNAASAILAMTQTEIKENESKTTIGTTMFGVTQKCVKRVEEKLIAKGYDVIIFHASGSGGIALEELINQDIIDTVIDITTHELADYLFGGIFSAGKKRLESAGKKGIMNIVAPGAIDMINFATINTIPEKFKNRYFYQHSPNITLMRTNGDENNKIAKVMIKKLRKSRGPVKILIPTKGFSEYDRENGIRMIDIKGKPVEKYWYNPEANYCFTQTLKKEAKETNIQIFEIESHINDTKFSEEILRVLGNH
jgi:uncharacterized protein (UPF0261 family)